MVRAVLQIKVTAGREAEFQQAWREIAEQVRLQPGSLRQALMRDPDNPSTFVIASDWSSRETFHEFERSKEQDELTAPLRDLRESARMTIQDVLEYVEGGT